ncbi:MAG: glycoside hydrolase [Armatimonadetes bacterium]|nr:glycoside hydrolase [Armatimonadota bacterium]
MFPSFFLAGFECATGYNQYGRWIDQTVATQHDQFVEEDYRRLVRAGIRGAREGVRWPLVDCGGRYDFSSIRPFVEAGRRFGVVQIWDLFHYGYPSDLNPLSREFVDRFAEYCYAVARYIGARTEGTAFFTPVNEPSYLAWAAGDAGRFAPHWRGRGWELKVALCRAAIAGIEAIWAACPHCRIVNVDPICRVVAPPARPYLREAARNWNNEIVFQGWDMLAGRLLPELGGSRRHLDIVGINYYWTNQWCWTTEWELTGRCTPLDPGDPNYAPLGDLVEQVWQRYGGEVMITETSHKDRIRGRWVRELASEAERLLDRGVPLQGICLYPILGMPEWHDRRVWSRMGLWDLVPASPTLRRVICRPMSRALREAQRRLARRFSSAGE